MNVELEIKPYSQGGVCVRALKFQVKWEGFLGKCHCRQPDSGNPTVRDEKGACGNVGQRLEGEQLTRSSRLRRGVYLKSTAQMLNWRSRAPYFYPTSLVPQSFFCPHPPPPGVFMISPSPCRALKVHRPGSSIVVPSIRLNRFDPHFPSFPPSIPLV